MKSYNQQLVTIYTELPSNSFNEKYPTEKKKKTIVISVCIRGSKCSVGLPHTSRCPNNAYRSKYNLYVSGTRVDDFITGRTKTAGDR